MRDACPDQRKRTHEAGISRRAAIAAACFGSTESRRASRRSNIDVVRRAAASEASA
jgi:hypothetical protein